MIIVCDCTTKIIPFLTTLSPTTECHQPRPSITSTSLVFTQVFSSSPTHASFSLSSHSSALCKSSYILPLSCILVLLSFPTFILISFMYACKLLTRASSCHFFFNCPSLSSISLRGCYPSSPSPSHSCYKAYRVAFFLPP